MQGYFLEMHVFLGRVFSRDGGPLMAGYVLIADDDYDAREILKSITANIGLRSVAVSNGNLVLETVAQETPDLILLDLLMPGLDGFSVLKKLQAKAATKNIPIIVLSAISDTRFLRLAGVSRIVPKAEFSVQSLQAMITDLVPVEKSVSEVAVPATYATPASV